MGVLRLLSGKFREEPTPELKRTIIRLARQQGERRKWVSADTGIHLSQKQLVSDWVRVLTTMGEHDGSLPSFRAQDYLWEQYLNSKHTDIVAFKDELERKGLLAISPGWRPNRMLRVELVVNMLDIVDSIA